MKKIFIFWLAVAVFFFVIYTLAKKNALPPDLPLPKEISAIKINGVSVPVDIEAENLIRVFKKSCGKPHDFKEFNTPENSPETVVEVIFNEADKWIFGGYHRMFKAHIVRHGDTAYLCDEQIKPRFENMKTRKAKK